jgi:TonB family protein
LAPSKSPENVAPKYPEDARRAGLMQPVVLECVVDSQGAVGKVAVLQGVPPLTDAAIKAVRQWRYEPTLLDGAPVPVIMTVTVNFVLSQTRFDDLLDSLDNENEHLRAAAARNLGVLRVGGSFDEGDRRQTIRELEGLVKDDPSPLVRAAAAHSLTRLDGRPFPPELRAPLPPRAPGAAATSTGTTRPVGWGLPIPWASAALGSTGIGSR